jgi:hypothetical protein
MNIYECFMDTVQYQPRLVKGTIAHIVNEAVQQPRFVDAGEWMLESMRLSKIIAANTNDDGKYNLLRATRARRQAVEQIPKLLTAWYLILSNPSEDSTIPADLADFDVEQLSSVIMSFDLVVV